MAGEAQAYPERTELTGERRLGSSRNCFFRTTHCIFPRQRQQRGNGLGNNKSCKQTGVPTSRLRLQTSSVKNVLCPGVTQGLLSLVFLEVKTPAMCDFIPGKSAETNSDILVEQADAPPPSKPSPSATFSHACLQQDPHGGHITAGTHLVKASLSQSSPSTSIHTIPTTGKWGRHSSGLSAFRGGPNKGPPFLQHSCSVSSLLRKTSGAFRHHHARSLSFSSSGSIISCGVDTE